MNEDEMKGKLKQAKGRIQSKWGELTDDEVERMEGDREELIGKVQERYGYSREQAEQEVDAFVREL